MKKTRTIRGRAALSVAAVVLPALGFGLSTAAPAAAASAGWCNGKTYVTFPSGAKGYVPTYNGKWNCTMSQGASGDHVRALQKTLKSCYGQNITVDGDFGPATKSALKSAQNMTAPMYPNVDIVGDGVYGPITAEYLSQYATRNGSVRCSALH